MALGLQRTRQPVSADDGRGVGAWGCGNRRGGVALTYAMFDMRSLPSAVAGLSRLTEQEQHALRLVAEGVAPREVAERVEISEVALYRLVAWVLDELEPAPAGMTIADAHAADSTRPATPAELDEFERLYGQSLPADDEG